MRFKSLAVEGVGHVLYAHTVKIKIFNYSLKDYLNYLPSRLSLVLQVLLVGNSRLIPLPTYRLMVT